MSARNAFPFLSGRAMEIARCPEAVAVRVSFTGELGYEIYVPAEYQRVLPRRAGGGGPGSRPDPAGSRALLSLRLEKSFPTWAAELGPDYSPMEPGLMRFVRLDKGDFVGRSALAATAKEGPRETLSTRWSRRDGVDCFGGEAVLRDGKYVGYVTSGGFGPCRRKPGLAYLASPEVERGGEVEVLVAGVRRRATIHHAPRLDVEGVRLRS